MPAFYYFFILFYICDRKRYNNGDINSVDSNDMVVTKNSKC